MVQVSLCTLNIGTLGWKHMHPELDPLCFGVCSSTCVRGQDH